ncbi:ATP synthase subunit O, mitochondrial-like protein [Drosera capensis]
MAISSRLRSTIPHLRALVSSSPSLSSSLRSDSYPARLGCDIAKSERHFATASGAKEAKVKVPVALFGGSGNYASALYLAAVKANALDKVESELYTLVEAIKNSPTFSQFTKDLSVPSDVRVKAINDICAQAKFSDVAKNFLVVLAENARLRHIDTIAKRFTELAMAHKGEVQAIVSTVIPLPAEEEKELKETLQEIIGQGKKVKLEQKVDPSILGGLVVEFERKVFDMSIRTRAKQMERFLREPVNLEIL